MIKKITETDDYMALFINDTPLLDVRAPIEYAKGALPCAINHYLLNDEQRALIGTCYKQQGHEAAIDLGYRLATHEIKEQRVKNWIQFVQENPAGYLFCFRGGKRSHIAQQWLQEAGYDYPLVKGGYKAMRSFLLEQLQELIAESKLIILSGKTGTGKTHLLNQLQGSINLEGLANHRGSSFGHRLGGQPSQIDFENSLAIQFLKHHHCHGGQPIILEDESKLIGRCSLPKCLIDKMQVSPIILIEEPIEHRVTLCLQEYITDNLRDLIQYFNAHDALTQLFGGLRNSMLKIKRRLGGQRFQQMSNILEDAITEHKSNDNLESYRHLIASLLLNYYDPMYEYQLAKKQGSVLYSGNKEEIFNNFTKIMKGIH